MSILKRHKNTIFGLNDELANLNNAIAAESQGRKTQAGELTSLSTTNKSSLVSAINEINTTIGSVSGASLQAAQNLADLTSAQDARTNLDVYSTTEINDAIAAAKLAMGTSYTVETLAERDALTDLDQQDRIFVKDDGDAKWALYKPNAIDDVTGAVTDWTKLADKDALDNSISAPALKASYESNPDTNAYTDAEKLKVGYVSVTGAVDLDDAVLRAQLAQDLDGLASTTDTASVNAIKQYALGTASVGGPKAKLENVVVVGDAITLTEAPRNGVEGVMNFATVRFIDENSVAYDAPVIASADPKKFIVQTDTLDQWDGKTVKVQYVYLSPLSISPA